MNQETGPSNTVPLVVDAVRMIDGHEMARCAYYSIASEAPMLDTDIQIEGTNRPFLFIQLEAIFLSAPNTKGYFNSIDEVNAMYEYAEQHDGIFVDINDIWVPYKWFGVEEIEAGMIFRIAIDQFIRCWKFRNDQIAVDEFLINSSIEEREEPILSYSNEETTAFQSWSDQQIEQSREIYLENRDNYLQKIEQ